MKEMLPGSLLVMILVACAGCSVGGSLPDFELDRPAVGGSAQPDAGLVEKLDGYTVQPAPLEQRQILESMLTGDSIGSLRFPPLANHFSGQFDADFRTRYNGLVARQFPDSGLPTAQPGQEPPFPVTNELEANALYSFRCLDLEHDGKVDLVMYSSTRFGSMPGLVVIGRTGSGFGLLFDNYGRIAALEGKAGRFYLRFVSIGFVPDAADVISTVAYDPASKTSRIDSKLFLAQQMELPAEISKPRAVKTVAPAILRAAPVVDDKTPAPTKDDTSSSGRRFTIPLYGNVMAEWPARSSGFLLAEQGAWSLVAFDTEEKPVRSALWNWDEPGRMVGDIREPLYQPWQYFLGWVETKGIK